MKQVWSARRSVPNHGWTPLGECQCIVNFELTSLMRISFNNLYVIDLATSYYVDVSWNFCRRKSLKTMAQVKLQKLESYLQEVEDFVHPKITLEQYMTRPHLAGNIEYY